MKLQTETEENYLKAIYHLSQDGKTVSTTALSKNLNTTPASVTDMIKKLGEKALVEYQPYKGVTLTTAGRTIGLRIIRKHRLWEVFLVNILNYSWDEIHETAEQLEHIHSPELIDKLDAFLGFPKFDPHGDPIPSAEGKFEDRKTQCLADCNSDEEFLIAGVLNHSPEFLQYLDKVSLTLGKSVRIQEKLPFAQSLEIAIEGKTLVIPGEISRNILVVKKTA